MKDSTSAAASCTSELSQGSIPKPRQVPAKLLLTTLAAHGPADCPEFWDLAMDGLLFYANKATACDSDRQSIELEVL